MKLMSFAAAALAMAPPGSAAPDKSSPSARATMSDAIGAILQADGQKARDLLKGLSPKELSAKDSQFRSCALSRIEQPIETSAPAGSDPFVAKVLAAYRTYWHRSLVSPSDRGAAEADLVARLSTLLSVKHPSKLADLEPLLAKALERRGFHSLEGKTGPLSELMLWSKQELHHEHVFLPEGQVSTPVYYLDDFLSRGWSTYFTCGKTGTGGWTKEDGLYLVVPSYKSLADENFRVNFLAHESQHFYDRSHFPGLPDWRLEYRAKLVELSLADKTLEKVLSSFTSNQGDDPDDSHSYANKHVLAAVAKRLHLPSAAFLEHESKTSLHRAAAEELMADTRELRARQTKEP